MPVKTELSPTLKQVYLFQDAFKAFEEDQASMRDHLGGKGAGLAQMSASGVNVPPGLTVATTACKHYSKTNAMPEGLWDEIIFELAKIEKVLNKKLGDAKNPLLLSVRSGAKFSMPGMMDTILNLGLNDTTCKSLAQITNNPRFAYDSYRRFIQMYSNVVMQIDKEVFEHALGQKKKSLQVKLDTDLTADNLKDLVDNYKALVKEKTGLEFPQDVHAQLKGATEAVFRSWNNSRAVYYRNLNKIDHDLGTAVNIQSMVFGNYDNNSATGVCFTRNPSTGEKELYGEYLVNAQGEDVVAGIRTPKSIKEMEREMPGVFNELVSTITKLENHYKDMQDIEFTIEQGKLYLLQTRQGKRTARSALKVAVDLCKEGLISKEDAIVRIDPNQLNQLLLPSFNPKEKDKFKKEGKLITTGLNASPGAAIGKIVFDPDEAESLSSKGEKVILVRIETCPDDIHGIVAAQGVVTCRGGMTSHAAVVARGMGKPCVVGCESLSINQDEGHFSINDKTYSKGQIISIDGSTGEVFADAIETEDPVILEDFNTLLEYGDEVRKLTIRTNADTPLDASVARSFGAQGIGLCRTEHMFMAQDRLPWVKAMILATTKEQRLEALAKLLPMQEADFEGIFEAMNNLPVTIRLLDPPLHEFLPKLETLIFDVASMKARKESGKELREKEILLARVRDLHESNPMMGLRGCRLGLIYPEIMEMQVRAIFKAAINAKAKGHSPLPEIMIPLISCASELELARHRLEACAKEVLEENKAQINYKFGTMIELPRACVTADEIAVHADFFSFGTNDLTQMTFGFSRDDAEGKFLQQYLEGLSGNKLLHQNPFEVLDEKGVGRLMKIACDYGRQVKPGLKLGICGEHGGEPASIAFAQSLGLDYVSCSPYRVPIARLAAAQAIIKAGSGSSSKVALDK
ncbi:MAG: pyruvate, phosphate dikinase [Candidatus Melainabacteria bacterium]|nr:pyruvate, phosphate dikinase [Candidatus Melainabacteria bacterium]